MEFEYFPFDPVGYKLVLLDTVVKHELVGSPYNRRRESCERVAKMLGQEFLRGATMERLDAIRDEISDEDYRRARFVIGEERRVLDVCDALQRGDYATVGERMYATHEGLSKDYEVSCEELDFLVDVARECGVTLMEAMISTLNPNFRVVQEYLPRLGTIRRYFASFCQYSSRYDKFRQGIVLNAFNPELSNGAMMDIGVYTVYPMVALFGRPLEVEAQGIVLSSGADGQGAVNFRYEGMNATVLYSKIANSSLPSEIQGEEGNLLLDAIHTIRDVAYLPRPAAASGRGDAPVRHSVGLPLERDPYYYEVAEFIDLVEQLSLIHI